MDFRALETFVWIARLGSFRAAARRLYTTQPAVSSVLIAIPDHGGWKKTIGPYRQPRLNLLLSPPGTAARHRPRPCHILITDRHDSELTLSEPASHNNDPAEEKTK